MKYFIITYGCQMNYSDSEKISAQLKNAGHRPVKKAKDANIIAVNFCSVRQSAVHRALAQLHKYKNKKLIAAGCLLPSDQKKLVAQNIAIWRPDDYFTKPPLRTNKFSISVPIMTGCNNFCSYCAVPYTRGREKSRPANEIITEIKQLLKNGVKEIVLLGQNVNSYKDYNKTSNLSTLPFKREVGGLRASPSPFEGDDRSEVKITNESIPINFPQLLKIINNLPENFWLSFITSHPKDMSDELIETMAKCAKIIPYLHLPIQSGDDKILRAMNRHYSVAHYKNLVKKLRLSFKIHRPSFLPLAISTDIIVGFPGETVKQFQNTLKLVKDVKFDMIYFARYSPRPGTAAVKLKDNVPPKEKKRRAQAINSLLKKQALILNKKYLNREVEILIEKVESNYAFGRTVTNKKVQLPRKNLKVGQFISAKIISATAWRLKAK